MTDYRNLAARFYSRNSLGPVIDRLIGMPKHLDMAFEEWKEQVADILAKSEMADEKNGAVQFFFPILALGWKHAS